MFPVERELGDLGVERGDHRRRDVHAGISGQDGVGVQHQTAGLGLHHVADQRTGFLENAGDRLLLGGLQFAIALLRLVLKGDDALLQSAALLLILGVGPGSPSWFPASWRRSGSRSARR